MLCRLSNYQVSHLLIQLVQLKTNDSGLYSKHKINNCNQHIRQKKKKIVRETGQVFPESVE